MKKMTTTTTTTTNYSIKIFHPTLGVLNEDIYVDAVQFKLLLKMIQGCLELNNDFTNFDGVCSLTHIPSKILKECVVITKSNPYTAVDHLKTKTI